MNPSSSTIRHSPTGSQREDVSRGVSLYDRSSDAKITFAPPAEWGRHSSWNLTEDGKGICLRRNAEPGESGRATEGSEHARDQ